MSKRLDLIESENSSTLRVLNVDEIMYCQNVIAECKTGWGMMGDVWFPSSPTKSMCQQKNDLVFHLKCDRIKDSGGTLHGSVLRRA